MMTNSESRCIAIDFPRFGLKRGIDWTFLPYINCTLDTTAGPLSVQVKYLPMGNVSWDLRIQGLRFQMQMGQRGCIRETHAGELVFEVFQ